MGNDDLIYTPNVIVFKTDELTNPIYPQIMPHEDWYMVDVITSAAPELWQSNSIPLDYETQITSRIKQILDMAATQSIEVLILGAWGCGAFKNPVDIIAKVFRTLLQNYNFATVEYALSHQGDLSTNTFAQALMKVSKDCNPDLFYNRRYTGIVEQLSNNQIFVFGSNPAGLHGGGAAGIAFAKFGAKWGEGDGMTGQCYAIPTMVGRIDLIRKNVEKFLSFAERHPEKEFLVTKIACGNAGFSINEIALMFSRAFSIKNIILPKEFVKEIERFAVRPIY